MKPASFASFTLPRRACGLLAASIAVLALAGCGGGGDGSPASPPPSSLGPGENAYDDPLAYSTAPGASLAAAEEAAAVTKHQITLGGSTLAYTARAGHLIARDPATSAAEASFFYVAYTLDGAAAATRPVTFFYNGGPGSASVWLHLGSFGPKRLATGVPAMTASAPFPLVDNAESLLDGSDLVFVDAVGTGYSEAIAPNTNASFWSVDADAAVFRDFVVRWLAANGRGASPRYLYGESYGGPRSAVLARRLQEAGVAVDGIVLQSPALDYNANCGLGGVSCASYLPSYAASGSYRGLASAALPDLDAWMEAMRAIAASPYGSAVDAVLGGAPVPAGLPPQLAAETGIDAAVWQTQFNLGPDDFRRLLVPGSLLGRYDARMQALTGSALAADDDPSTTFIAPSFASAIAGYLRDTLRYGSASTYVVTSQAINFWDFAHAGRDLPDTVPDLQAALAANAALRVLAVSGYHDLATPFRQTELDLQRLGGDARVQTRAYPGGHMSYLDDATRVRQKADLAAFYAAAAAAQGGRARALAVAPRPAAERVGTMPTAPQPPLAQPALQTPLRDPWLPPRR